LLFASLQVWAALAPEAVKDKEAFYASQQRTSSGFMRYAKTTLELLITLTGDREIVSHSTADSSCLRHVLGGGGGVKHMKYIKQLHSNHLNYHPGTSTQCFMRYAKTKLKLVTTPTGDRDINAILYSLYYAILRVYHRVYWGRERARACVDRLWGLAWQC
jgi:hypothetical protein